MAIPKFQEDMDIISKLGEYPGADDGLSTSAFKAKFDEGSNKIKKFLNEILIPELDLIVDVRALINGILDSTLTMSDKAANAKVTGDALNRKLNKSGDTMSGILNMSGKRISSLGTPLAATDAASKEYCDAKHNKFSITVPASGWSGSAAPYTQVIAVSGILASDNPHYGIAYSGNHSDKVAQKEAFSFIDDLDTADGSVTMTCFDGKPNVDLTIQMEVNR